MKNFSLSLMMALMMALMAPLAFADDTMPVEEAPVADSEMVAEETVVADASMMMEDKMMWPPYYPSSIYLNAMTTVEVAVDDLALSGNYMAQGADQKTLEEKLARAAMTLRDSLESFGKVTVSEPWVYPTWDYVNQVEMKNSFEGGIYVRIELTNSADLDTVKALYTGNGIKDSYLEPDYTKMWLAEEAEAIPALKEMLNQKKANYELLLDAALTQVLSANLWSWVDMATYNVETGMATLNVSADMSYMLPMGAEMPEMPEMPMPMEVPQVKM